MTDSDWPSVAVLNLATHKAIEQQMGRDLDLTRWRGNLWLDEAEPWVEADWVGRDKSRSAGSSCTSVNRSPAVRPPQQIRRRVSATPDTLGVLNGFGHQEMGVYAEVMQGGLIRAGDIVRLI